MTNRYNGEEWYYHVIDHDRGLPIPWLSPVRSAGTFSEYSDVWAFGVTKIYHWDGKMFMNSISNRVTGGYTLPKPIMCPSDIEAEVLRKCFSFDATQRPRFSEIEQAWKEKLSDMMEMSEQQQSAVSPDVWTNTSGTPDVIINAQIYHDDVKRPQRTTKYYEKNITYTVLWT